MALKQKSVMDSLEPSVSGFSAAISDTVCMNSFLAERACVAQMQIELVDTIDKNSRRKSVCEGEQGIP